MSLEIGTALRDGVDRTTARNGLVMAAIFVVLRLVNAIVQQSLILVQFEGSVDPEALAETPSFRDAGITAEDVRGLLADATPLAALDALSLPALVGILLLLAVVAEAIRIVAVRVFVGVETESIPADLVTRNLLPAVANGIVGGIVVGILVFVGVALLVLPGVFLAIAFLFLRQEIAVADKNFIEAMSGSWNLTAGSRIELFVLFVSLVLLGLIVPPVVGLVGGPVVGSAVSTAAGAVVLAYSVAVISGAYNQLRTEREVAAAEADADPDPLEEVDDELLP